MKLFWETVECTICYSVSVSYSGFSCLNYFLVNIEDSGRIFLGTRFSDFSMSFSCLRQDM